MPKVYLYVSIGWGVGYPRRFAKLRLTSPVLPIGTVVSISGYEFTVRFCHYDVDDGAIYMGDTIRVDREEQAEECLQDYLGIGFEVAE